jgi:glyceraldehyde 3-phosphate dehydrogenase
MRVARIAVNGLGRIGRAFVKLVLARPELEVVAVNDLVDPEDLVYLLRFDSVYGRYREPVVIDQHDPHGERSLVVAGHRMRLLNQRNPSELPWAELAIDIVVESTGALKTFEQARDHLKAGARHVVLTAPAHDEDSADARTVLMGVNVDDLRGAALSSNGSCTTNSVSPIMQVLSETIGVRKAFLNTVHGYTSSQSLVDGPSRGSDFRRGRAAAANIVPSTTGAAIAVARAIPALRGKFGGIAARVPVLVGSVSSVVFVAARPTTVDEINGHLEEASKDTRWRGVLAVTRETLVSSDVVGDPHAAIADLSLTSVVDGDLCSVYSWYDNEFGYTNSLVEHVAAAARVLHPTV